VILEFEEEGDIDSLVLFRGAMEDRIAEIDGHDDRAKAEVESKRAARELALVKKEQASPGSDSESKMIEENCVSGEILEARDQPECLGGRDAMLEEEEDKRKMAKLSIADESLRAIIEDFKGDFDTAFEEMRVEAKMSYRQFVRYGLIEKYSSLVKKL
jgi:hypothetical protein